MKPQIRKDVTEEIITNLGQPLSAKNEKVVGEWLDLAVKMNTVPFPNADKIAKDAQKLVHNLEPFSDEMLIPLKDCGDPHFITMKAFRSALDYLQHLTGPSPKLKAKAFAAEFALALDKEFSPPERGWYQRLQDIAGILYGVFSGKSGEDRVNMKRTIDAMRRGWKKRSDQNDEEAAS